MRRYSVRKLMALIVVCAVGLAALRNANELWAGIMLTFVFGAVAVSVIGAVILQGNERYGWAGFAVFGGGYLAIALGPVLSDVYKPYLGTTVALSYVQSKVATVSSSTLSTMPTPQMRRDVLVEDLVNRIKIQGNADDPGIITVKNRIARLDRAIEQKRALDAAANRWNSFLPGAVNSVPFFCVGHCLFGFLAGLVGGTVAVWFYARRERTKVAAQEHPG
jgi:hypothetical protein